MSKYQMLFCISVIFSICIITIESCETPDNLPGVCKSLLECPVLLERFKANKSDPYLKQCVCGIRNYDLCCPLGISSIKDHRNFELINNQRCGIYSSTRVENGYKTGLFQYKWNVLLQFQSSLGDEQLKFMCGGSLIADQYVLSAAHCVTEAKNKRYDLVSVRLGEWDQSTEMDCFPNQNDKNKVCAPPVQDIKVKSYKLHEKYNDNLKVNDIMLIKLEHPVHYARNIKTVCLPTNEDELITKAVGDLTITGWGKTELASHSDILLYAHIPFLPLKNCTKRMQDEGLTIQLQPSHICAGGVNVEEVCQGVSGSPLVGGIETETKKEGFKKIKIFQLGVASLEIGCSYQGAFPGIYTNVAYFMNWILDQMD